MLTEVIKHTAPVSGRCFENLKLSAAWPNFQGMHGTRNVLHSWCFSFGKDECSRSSNTLNKFKLKK